MVSTCRADELHMLSGLMVICCGLQGFLAIYWAASSAVTVNKEGLSLAQLNLWRRRVWAYFNTVTLWTWRSSRLSLHCCTVCKAGKEANNETHWTPILAPGMWQIYQSWACMLMMTHCSSNISKVYWEIRCQSRPDTRAAPSPNKCTCVRRQSYSKG